MFRRIVPLAALGNSGGYRRRTAPPCPIRHPPSPLPRQTRGRAQMQRIRPRHVFDQIRGRAPCSALAALRTRPANDEHRNASPIIKNRTYGQSPRHVGTHCMRSTSSISNPSWTRSHAQRLKCIARVKVRPTERSELTTPKPKRRRRPRSNRSFPMRSKTKTEAGGTRKDT